MTLGIFFVLLALIGVVMPGFMGMHLSMMHNLIHLVTGALALWAGSSDDSRKAYNCAVGLGTVYGLLGIAGFVIGAPGYPGVGNMAADQNLLRLIPNVLEIGTADHSANLLVSAFFLFSAYAWKKSFQDTDRSIIDNQRRQSDRGVTGVGGLSQDVFTTNTTGSNVGTDLHRAKLGRTDIDRGIDQSRRKNFEDRI